MAGKRTEMSKIKQILLLHKDGMSNRKIGERLGLYKETVNKYVNAAKSCLFRAIGTACCHSG